MKFKRVLAIILTVLTILCSVPLTALAAEGGALQLQANLPNMALMLREK